MKNVFQRYRGTVSLGFRDFPLSDTHPQAELAAKASRCAGEQGKYWEFHDLLFKSVVGLARKQLLESAVTVGADSKSSDACLDSGKYKVSVQQDVLDGARAGVSGTPTFFINGILLDDNQSFSVFKEIIEQALSEDTRN